jgi:hypothetical protein
MGRGTATGQASQFIDALNEIHDNDMLTTESQRGPAATERSKAIRRFRRFHRFEKRKHLLIREICEICGCNSLHGAKNLNVSSTEDTVRQSRNKVSNTMAKNGGQNIRPASECFIFCPPFFASRGTSKTTGRASIRRCCPNSRSNRRNRADSSTEKNRMRARML